MGENSLDGKKDIETLSDSIEFYILQIQTHSMGETVRFPENHIKKEQVR